MLFPVSIVKKASEIKRGDEQMKNKLFKSTVSVLLALLLCLSVFAPAVSAASVGEAVLGEGGEVPANEQSNSATVAVNVTGEGSVKLLSDGTELTDHIPVGASFTVEAQPNTDRGYQPGTVVVTRNGIEQEGPSYGPAENGDAFEVNATFEFYDIAFAKTIGCLCLITCIGLCDQLDLMTLYGIQSDLDLVAPCTGVLCLKCNKSCLG